MSRTVRKDSEIKLVPIVTLVACERNGRSHCDQAAMAELIASVGHQGVIHPLIVRTVYAEPGNTGAAHLEVVCGHRRLEAARRAGMMDVPVIERVLTDEQAAEMQLTENLQRVDLSPLEEAEAIEKLLQLVPLEEAAIRIGKSRAYLASRRLLIRLPQGARLALEAGTLSLSVALMIARIPDEAMRDEVAAEVEDGRAVYDSFHLSDQPTMIPLTLGEARKAFSRTMLRLKHATFDVKADFRLPGALAGMLPCDQCPKRSGNAPDLFGDLEDTDVCTDPACFAQKRDIGWEKHKALAEAKGYQVLPDKRAKKILRPGSDGRGASVIRSDSGFVGPAKKVGRDGDSRQWLQVAKAAKAKPLTLAVRDPLTDRPVLLWRVEDLAELLPASEKARAALPKAPAEPTVPKKSVKKPAGPEEWRVRQEAKAEIENAIAAAAMKLAPLAFLRLWIEVSVPAHVIADCLKSFGMTGKEKTRDLPAATCQAILALDSPCDEDEFCAALGVDAKSIHEAARKRLLERAAGPTTVPVKGKTPSADKAKSRAKTRPAHRRASSTKGK